MDARTRIRKRAVALITITFITFIITTDLFFLDLSHHHLNLILGTCGIIQIVIILCQITIFDMLQKPNASSIGVDSSRTRC